MDPFAGSGTTLMAAEMTGRLGRAIEYDPACCDRILRRFELLTGKQPTLAASGQSLEQVADERLLTGSTLEESAV